MVNILQVLALTIISLLLILELLSFRSQFKHHFFQEVFPDFSPNIKPDPALTFKISCIFFIAPVTTRIMYYLHDSFFTVHLHS